MEGKSERETENPKQALHCQHRAWYGAWTHKLWHFDLSWNQESDVWLSHLSPSLPGLLRYNWYLTLCKFKVYRQMFIAPLSIIVKNWNQARIQGVHLAKLWYMRIMEWNSPALLIHEVMEIKSPGLCWVKKPALRGYMLYTVPIR